MHSKKAADAKKRQASEARNETRNDRLKTIMPDATPEQMREHIDKLQIELGKSEASCKHEKECHAREMSQQKQQHESEIAELNTQLDWKTWEADQQRKEVDRYKIKMEEVRLRHKADLEQLSSEHQTELNRELAAKRRHYVVESDEELEKCDVCAKRHVGLQRERS